MDRFFAGNLGPAGTQVVLTPEETRHLRVRRLTPGDEAILFDGQGREAVACMTEMDGRQAVLEIVELRPAPPDVLTLVTVATAMPKGPRMADLVRGATEAGVWRILPMVTERSVVRPEIGKPGDRWAKIATEAAKQSRRAHVPEVLPVASFEQVLDIAATHDLAMIADLGVGSQPIREVMAEKRRPGSVLIAIGPEGGFSELEVVRAVERGLRPVRNYGPVMRVETAAVALTALVLYEYS